MNRRLVGKSFLAVGLASTLLGVGVAWTIPIQAGAAVHKKHPKKHHHHKHHGGSATAKHLKSLGSEVAKEKGATFQVVYKTTYAGHSQSVTFAQEPPKLLIKTTSGSLIETGTETLFCSPGSCIGVGGTSDPLAPLQNLFSPTTAVGFFHQAAAEAAAKLAGYSVKFSSTTFGGLASECASVAVSGVSEKYCVSRNGLLTYAGSSAGSVELTSYSGSVPGGEFTPPSGVTIITSPTG